MLVKKEKKGIPLVISAPSGGGKTTLLKGVVKICPNLKRSVSYTTRERRKGEKNGRDYHFISEGEFLAMIENGQFLEWAQVYGHYYGTPLKAFNDNIARGVDTLLAIDIQGATKIKEKFPRAVLVFVLPPSLRELRRRLKNRDTHESVLLSTRFESAREEILFASEYDYIIVNRDLQESVAQLRAIITAERLRRGRYIINGREGNIN